MTKPEANENSSFRNPFGGELLEVGARASRPQSLIISIYGSYVRDFGHWFPVASILRLLDELGVDETATRNALSRLKRRQVFAAESRNGLPGYSFTPEALVACIANDEGIYGRRTPPENADWVLAAFSIPESSRKLRYRLRAELTRRGFAQVEGGLWVAPVHLQGQLHTTVEGLNLQGNVSVFEARYTAFEATDVAVRSWWDLDSIASGYDTFINMYLPMEASYRRKRAPVEPVRAFVDYMRLMTSWRTLPNADPTLAPRYLPEDWSGYRAAAMFYGLHDRLAPTAREHVARIIRQSSGDES